MGNPFKKLNALLLSFKNAFNGMLPHVFGEVGALLLIGALVCGFLALYSPVVAAVAAVLLVLASVTMMGMEYSRREQEKHHRGRVMMFEDRARQVARKKRKPGDRGILWGKLRIPTEDAMTHFCIIGGIGSGKTLTMRMLMKDQFPLMTPGSDHRALIFDSKEDFVQGVAGLDIHPGCSLHILNPFDVRRTAWNIAADIDSNPIAANFANIFFPSSPNASSPYFEKTPRLLLSAVLRVFIKRAKKSWTLRHVVLVMLSQKLIHAITSLEPQAASQVENAMNSQGRSLSDVLSTISSTLAVWGDIAASWEGAKKSISVREWLRTTSILVLPKYKPAESETLRIYSLFINIVSSNLSMLSESRTRRTWVFLDEFTQLGPMHGLPSLILEGRDKGFSCVIGTQQPGLVFQEYGYEIGTALLSECANKCFLKAGGSDAAEWVSKAINEFVPNWNPKEGEEKPKPSYGPQYFLALDKAGYDNGLSGIYLASSISGWKAEYTPQDLKHLVPRKNEKVKQLIEIDPASLDLKPWGKEDAELFGLPWDDSDGQPKMQRPVTPKTPPQEPTSGNDEDPLAGVNPTTL